MRTMRKYLCLMLVIALIALFLGGCSGSDNKPDTSTNAGTKEPAATPSTLTIYAGTNEEHAAAVVREFELETGIQVSFVRMSGGEILGRIRAEKENPGASVWYGGPADTFIAAKNEGLLEQYKSSNASMIPEQYMDPDHYWSGVYIGYLGFISNKSILEELGVEMPKSWQDLLKPEFKDNIVMANPGSSGTAYTVLSTIVQLMGEDDGLEYMKKLDGQVRQYATSGGAPINMVGQGEIAIGINFLSSAINFRNQGYSDILLSTPEEGTGYEIGAVAIIAGAPELEAAKMFIDWSLTKEAQEIGQKVGSYQFLTNPEAISPKEADEIKDAKLIEYDFEWAGTNRQSLLEKWNNAVN